MVAVRLADLSSPCGRGLGKDGRTALAVAGAGRITAGDLVVWLKPVAVTRAVVRRDGRVQAAGHPADHARLGLAEERLDELCGAPGVIDQITRSVMLEGRVTGTARRAMTPALAIRFTLLMTLMPDADYPAVMETLLGDLILVPWQRPYRLPTAAVACTWRAAIGRADAQDAGISLLDGPGGLIGQLTARVIERALGAEMDDHLGYVKGGPAGNGTGNSRNGSFGKTVTTTSGPVRFSVPRDRKSGFEPRHRHLRLESSHERVRHPFRRPRPRLTQTSETTHSNITKGQQLPQLTQKN